MGHFFEVKQSNKTESITSLSPIFDIFFSICVQRVLRADSSPYFAVHQVVPGDHVQETVQGELVSEQLRNGMAQVRSTHVCDT